MKRTITLLLLTTLLLAITSYGFAMPSTVTLKAGMSQAQTDIYKSKQENGMIGLSYEMWVKKYLSVGISPYVTRIQAGSKLGSNFKSNIVGADLNLKFRPYWKNTNLVMEGAAINRIAPYVTAGIGLVNFFPRGRNGHHYAGYPDDYSYTALVAPALGAGLTFFTKYDVDFDLGFQKNMMMSDYLEGYEKGEFNDSYWMAFLGISHTFGANQKRPKPRYEFSKEQPLILNGVTFKTGSAELTDEALIVLNDVIESLSYYTAVELEIQGHTDNTGSEELNQELSKNRAESVKAYLVSKGIAESRLTTAGFGPSRPVASNDTPDGRAQNRRIEFVKTK